MRICDFETRNKPARDVREVLQWSHASRARPEQPMTISTHAKGTAFTRFAIAIARAKGNLLDARIFAEQWISTPQVLEVIKAAVAAGGTTSGAWSENLHVISMWQDFLDVLRPATILGRLAGVRPVPFNCNVARVTGGSGAAWVGQGKPATVSALALDTVSLAMAKIQSIVVITEELLRISNPAAEAVIRRDLINSLAQFQDSQFIDPTVTASADVRPASITNGAPGASSTGSTVAQITADVALAFASGIAGNVSYQTGAWVMHPRTANYLGSKLTTGNLPMWPTISIRGGTWFGLPVIVSAAVPVESGGDTSIVLLDAQEVLVAQGPVTLDSAGQAALQMVTNPQTGATANVSLWQNNLTALRADQYLNWARARDAGVYVIDSVGY
jgi:HK97 family phage major capsid protein